MREFQERRLLRKVVFSRLTCVFLAIVLIFFGYSAAKIYLRLRRAASANKLIEKQIAGFKIKKAELEANISRLESESGIEEEIRNKFPVQKPGEKAVIIIEEEIKINDIGKNGSPPGFFEKIRHFFQKIRNSP